VSAIQVTSGGATTAPRHEPLLNNPMAKARSRAGNHSETALTPPGQLPASPNPSRKRNSPKWSAELATACSMAATDHQVMVNEKPRRVPSQSMMRPEPACMRV